MLQWRERNKSSKRGDQGGRQGSNFIFINHVKDLRLLPKYECHLARFDVWEGWFQKQYKEVRDHCSNPGRSLDQRDGSRGGKGEWIRETCRLENDGLAM